MNEYYYGARGQFTMHTNKYLSRLCTLLPTYVKKGSDSCLAKHCPLILRSIYYIIMKAARRQPFQLSGSVLMKEDCGVCQWCPVVAVDHY